MTETSAEWSADVSEIRDRRHASWFWADKAVIDRYGREIGVYGVAVYMLLARHADARGQCYPSLTKISQRLGLARHTVIQTLETLIAAGLIEKETRTAEHGGKASNIFTLLKIPEEHQETGGSAPDALGVVHGMHQASAPDALGVVHGMHQASAPDALAYLEQDPLQQEPVEKEKKHPPPPPSEGGAAGLVFLESSVQDQSREPSADFERWWNLYPSHRRVHKKSCATLWNSKHLDARSEAICENTAAMKRTKQWQAGKIPNSTTYLKQERYETSPTDTTRSSGMSDSLRAQLEEIERQFIAAGGKP